MKSLFRACRDWQDSRAATHRFEMEWERRVDKGYEFETRWNRKGDNPERVLTILIKQETDAGYRVQSASIPLIELKRELDALAEWENDND